VKLIFEGDHAHGTRACYVRGCRCAPCRQANTTVYHKRQRRAKEALADFTPRAPIAVEQKFTRRDGSIRTRTYLGCPGIDESGCPRGRHLRKDSVGGICGDCRVSLVWNGLVDAKPARRHLKRLSKRGVGYKQVAAACDIGTTTVFEILSGQNKQTRKRTADAILAVDEDAVADHGLIPAGPTWKLLRELEAEYFTKGEVARLLGYKSPCLQIGRKRVLARTHHRVARLYRRVVG